MKGFDKLLSTDHYVADLIATLGTADIVLGSVDKNINRYNVEYSGYDYANTWS